MEIQDTSVSQHLSILESENSVRTQFRVPRVSTVNRKFPTVNRKFPTGNSKLSTAELGNKEKAINIDDKGYWDSGCSWHMTGNISYLSYYKPYDGGTPRQPNMYSIDLNNVVPHKEITCLVAKACADECMLWHKRLGHLNFKTMNRLVRNNLVKGLPSKCFENDHTCVACLKGKQHKASCKTKLVNSVTKPLYTLHIDLFRPTSVSSLNHKWCDNKGEFKNKEINDFCSRKGIKREFSNARTPQQNGVAERRNRTLIEAARTMLADAKLSVTFWAEAVNTACYVQNRVLVNKSQNKTPYELFNIEPPTIGFLKPFGCHVMILNTLDHLGKIKAKGDEGYFIGYSMSSKAFRVFNKRTKRVEENLHVDFLENKLIEKGAGRNWLFDIDTLTNSMNYVSVVSAGTTSTNFSGTMDAASQDVKKDVSSLRYIALPNCGNSNHTATSTNPPADQTETLTVVTPIPTVSSPVPTACLNDSPQLLSDSRLISKRVTSQDDTPSLDNILTLTNKFEDILRVTTNSGDTNGVEADLSNMENNISASPTLTFRIHKDHPTKPKKISDALKDPSWVEAMQEELLQFKIQNVWSLVDYPKGVRPIGTKWVHKNKKDERGIVIRNKAMLVAQGHTHEEGIDYEEVFALVCLFYGTIDEEVYVMQPPRFQDLEFPTRVYKVEKAMYGLHQAPRVWYDVRSANTPINKENPWGKDGTGNDVDLHLYRSMIGSLMYLTASRPDIMFVVCACARHQVTPKECHLHAVKRIFRYLKSNPKLGIWYPKDSPFDLVAYSDSDYGGATQDRKSTTGGCQILGRRLISWQCKKQTIMATSTTEAEYVAAASGCGQVL
nr:hypothetical protein [Tanacetum cinerariifolium]